MKNNNKLIQAMAGKLYQDIGVVLDAADQFHTEEGQEMLDMIFAIANEEHLDRWEYLMEDLDED